MLSIQILLGDNAPARYLSSTLGVYNSTEVKGKAMPVTERGGPLGCETSRLPHFLDNQLRDGGEVVGPTRRTPFTPMKIPGTHFR
jgi:hypothetical protein